MRKEKIFLDQKAQEVLEGNDKGGYTIPTAGLYPYQWNWDSAFAAWLKTDEGVEVYKSIQKRLN